MCNVAHLTEFLTLKEAAALLRLSPATIWRRIKSGKIEACYFGERSCRIPRSAIEEFVERSMRSFETECQNGG